VFQARDAALQLLRQRSDFGKLPTGAEVDAAARNVIRGKQDMPSASCTGPGTASITTGTATA